MKILAMTLALAAAPVLAGTPIDETRPLASDGRLLVENLKGRISIEGWDREEVHVGGTLGEGVERLRIGNGGDTLSVVVEYPESRGWFFNWGSNDSEPTTLVIRAPRGVALELESVSADIEAGGLRGPSLQAESVSGDVRLRLAAAEVVVETVSGDQDLEIEATRLSAESVSGDIRAQGSLSGRVNVETVSGSARVQAREVSEFVGATVSGDLGFEGSLAAGGDLRAEALSGDIEVRIDRPAGLRVTAESFSGRIGSDLGEVKEAEYGPGRSLEARVGDGATRLRLESFSGDITLELR
ncbi:MAG TPA: DUF4097 family beta strand repeat-containing protein [Xanthomonadaceae bacterium]|nr:DUF4097 family beta strand repeat-containing protein [Xanthomonadaceae bacterium]